MAIFGYKMWLLGWDVHWNALELRFAMRLARHVSNLHSPKFRALRM